jgi:hypothetical protein
MTFYNHIESARCEMFKLVNGWTREGAETKARISESLDQARREYMQMESENAKLRGLLAGDETQRRIAAIGEGAVPTYHSTETVDEARLVVENAKLRDSLKALMMGTNAELCADRDEPDCEECSMHYGEDGCTVVDAMELLGIDMYGEPLGEER